MWSRYYLQNYSSEVLSLRGLLDWAGEDGASEGLPGALGAKIVNKEKNTIMKILAKEKHGKEMQIAR